MRSLKSSSDEATSRPPQLPRRLRPSAVASRGTRHSSVRDGLSSRRTPPRAHAIARGSAHFDADRVPAAVLLPGRRVAEVVLLAQFVGDARRRRIEIARVADDLGAAAAVVGHVAQRDDIHAIVDRRAATRPPAARRPAAGLPPGRRRRPRGNRRPPAERERQRDRRTRRRRRRRRRRSGVSPSPSMPTA